LGKTVEVEGLRQNGERFPMELSLSGCGTGRARTVTGIVRDISERKELQRQLVLAERQASAALVAGSIGHELNNALTPLLGYADLLAEAPGDSGLASKCGEVFSRQCQRLALHAQNLLELGKPRMPVMQRMAVQALLDRVTEMLVVSGVLKRYRLVKNYGEGLPPVVADESLLEQVVRNLLINAAHSMGEGGCLTVETAVAVDGPYVEFCVADTGHGIPKDKTEEIFRPFFTTKEEGKGTGLGLYICKQIVDEHRGYILVESEPGVGTKMSVGLPAIERETASASQWAH
jgi:signal transduction histidine kinase